MSESDARELACICTYLICDLPRQSTLQLPVCPAGSRTRPLRLAQLPAQPYQLPSRMAAARQQPAAAVRRSSSSRRLPPPWKSCCSRACPRGWGPMRGCGTLCWCSRSWRPSTGVSRLRSMPLLAGLPAAPAKHQDDEYMHGAHVLAPIHKSGQASARSDALTLLSGQALHARTLLVSTYVPCYCQTASSTLSASVLC